MKTVRLFDTTLRDGGNIVGHGFNKEITCSVVQALLNCGIQDIEVGNCKGLGAYEYAVATKAPTDKAYFDMLQPYMTGNHRIGMFQLAQFADAAKIRQAKEAGLAFIRVGANAGDGATALNAIKLVKESGMMCRYSLMKAYVLSPEELAQEAKMLQDAGVDRITIMDSAGTMLPKDVATYVSALKEALSIPVGFHGHSNLGLSQANALAAVEMGADEIDGGLLGMARSAGNCATEIAAVTLQKLGYLSDVAIYPLLSYLDTTLIPLMADYGYHPAVKPIDLVLGIAGCHSNALPLFQKVAAEENVPLFPLIVNVSAINRKDPDEQLIRSVAHKIPD